MFARLSGQYQAVSQDQGIVDVGGVGYLVQCSRKTITQLGLQQDHVTLLIETNVREDAIQLFGFQSAQEQRWFRLLTSVQGVGAKAGLAILSVCSPQDLSLAIAAGDKAMITRADGVGPKLATRLLTELKDKAANLVPAFGAGATATPPNEQPVQAQLSGVNEEAVSALVNLGYQRAQAYGVVAKLCMNEGADMPLSELIKDALQELAA